MPDERPKQDSARSFERRIVDVFEALEYHTEKSVDFPEIDFFVKKFEFPLEIRALVELKYYEESLVSASTVYKVLSMLQKYKVNNALIVTTLGFTREAKKLAEKTEEKIVLLTEAELADSVPMRRANYDAFLRSSYIQSSVKKSIELDESLYKNLVLRLPHKALSELLSEFTSHEEVAKIIVEKIPKERIFGQLVKSLEPTEINKILAELPRKTTKPMPRKKQIEDTYNKAKTVSDPNKKGRLLEQVMQDIFGSVPGLKVVGSRVDDSIEEVDLQVRNYNQEHVWAEFEGMIFVECKNWSKPVGSKEIDNFKGKLERNGIRAGILVSTMGVTGSGLEGAWGAIKMYLQSGYKIVVLEEDDLKDIFRCADISEKVDAKYVYLYKIGSKSGSLS